MSEEITTPQEPVEEQAEEQVEEQAPFSYADVDSMSDEELDKFLDDYTEAGSDTETWNEIPDEPEESEESEAPAETPEETPAEDEPEEEPVDPVDPEEEPEKQPILGDYSEEEVATMQSIYEDLFKNGIKAKGSVRTIRDADHLKSLVQLGIGASENNRMIKPYLRHLRSLEKNGIDLSEENVSFIVDVLNGNEEAIKELVFNKAKLDEDTIASWIDSEDGPKTNYVPNPNNVISESEFKLREITKEIENSPKITETIEFVKNIDDAGKNFLSENPEVVKLLNADMENGHFDLAMDEVRYRMDMGLLPDQSILFNYISVFQDPEFLERIGYGTEQKNTKTNNNNRKEEAVKAKKRIAKSPRKSVPNKKAPNKQVSIDKMSDEELDKLLADLEIID
jgi:hypothetical protein